MAGICLYVNSLGKQLDMKKFLGGRAAEGKTIIKVKSNNSSLKNSDMHLAAIDLRDKLIANPGTALAITHVVCHSQGSQVACKMIREWTAYLLANGVNPAYVRFYLGGCPEMKFTGSCYLWPTLEIPVYPGAGVKCSDSGGPHNATCPTPMDNHGGYGVGFGIPAGSACPWNIWFIINQFDGFADCPSNYAAVPALDQRVTFFGIDIVPPWFEAGNIFSRLKTSPQDENRHASKVYTRWIDDPNAFTYTDPTQTNVKYVYLRTYPYPPAIKYKIARFKARNADEAGRPTWDAAWTTRPIAIPPPDYATVPSWIPYDPQ